MEKSSRLALPHLHFTSLEKSLSTYPPLILSIRSSESCRPILLRLKPASTIFFSISSTLMLFSARIRQASISDLAVASFCLTSDGILSSSCCLRLARSTPPDTSLSASSFRFFLSSPDNYTISHLRSYHSCVRSSV